MEVQFHIHNTDLVDALRNYVERKLHFSLGRFISRLGRVTVKIADINGPRGGVDKACRISAEMLPGRKLIWQEAVDANLFVAVDHATERIGRSFGRAVARDRELRATRESVRTLEYRE
jgi:ribosome-associated translation inhibitor RaiA